MGKLEFPQQARIALDTSVIIYVAVLDGYLLT
jgi:hypothetical protein